MIQNAIIIRASFQDFLGDGVRNVTPHSALLHVGLKSLVPSGHLRNTILNIKL
ncbi:hypothetical protein Barb7_01210 [Bacteroidales bacterium Barb7]|nr:hypothetical protein Barb7_01210 [Bacteroidales bacterium Barb7]